MSLRDSVKMRHTIPPHRFSDCRPARGLSNLPALPWRAPKPIRRKTPTAHLGFEAKLWLAADKLRNNMDATE